MKNAGLMKPGTKLGAFDGVEVSHSFQLPVEMWADIQKRYPDVVAGLRSNNHQARQKAANELAALFPQYVVSMPVQIRRN